MTTGDVNNILLFLRGCYPAFYRNTTEEEMKAIRVAWSVLFSGDDYDYDTVFDAVKKCVAGKLAVRDCGDVREATDGAYRRFPPQPGVIVEALEYDHEIGRYARRLKMEREKRRLQENRSKSLPGGYEDGQQDENRVVYAYVEPRHRV